MDKESLRPAQNSLFRRMLIYFFGNIGTKLVTLVLTRLQSQLILPEHYGQISLITTMIPQLVSICFLEMWSGLLRFMYDQDELQSKKIVFSNAISLAILLLPVFALTTGITAAFTGLPELLPYLLVMGVVTLLDLLYQFSSRGLNRNKLYAVTGIITSLVTGFSQILLLSFNIGAMAMIISPIIGSLTAVIIYEKELVLIRKVRFKLVQREDVLAMTKFCLPLAVNAVAYFALTKFNEIYISRQAGDIALSNLTVANKTGMFLTIFISIFSLAWQEQAFSVSHDKGRESYFSKTLNQYSSFLGLALFCLIPAGRLLFRILIDGENYGEAAIVLIPFSLAAACASALSNFMGHIFSAEKRNNELFYTTVIGAVVNVLMMSILYPLVGLHAANLALLAGFIVTFVARYILIRRRIKMELDLRMVATRLVLIATVTISFYLYTELSVQLPIMIGAVALSAFMMRTWILQLLRTVLKKKV